MCQWEGKDKFYWCSLWQRESVNFKGQLSIYLFSRWRKMNFSFCFFTLSFVLRFKEFHFWITSVKKKNNPDIFGKFDVEILCLVVWKWCFRFGKVDRKGPDIGVKVFCIWFLFILTCMCPCFHRFGYVLFCSAVCHGAMVDAIVGVVCDKCVAQCLVCPSATPK